jgi:tetratricopeptide (TPR) repeat protein
MIAMVSRTPDQPSPQEVEEVIALIRKGQTLTAFALLPELEMRAPQWLDGKALTTAARLAERLGGGPLARSWHRINFRRHLEDDVCFMHRGWELGWTLGFPRALRIVEARMQKPDMLPRHRADLLALAAGFLSSVRDFARAARLYEEALAIRPREAWLLCSKANMLRQQDRREEALTLCCEALTALPESGNAMNLASDLLIDLGREDEAEQLLRDGCARTEIADLRWQLYVFCSERERPDEALYWLAEYERHSPLLNEKARTALRGNRATLHLLRGDLKAAREDASACGSPYYGKLAAALERPEAAAGARTRLSVGFVRQNHMTCGPATLAALAAHWGQPSPHLEIAEKICYDGTAQHSERRWTEEQGLDGREFRVTPEVTRALLARGVPFTLVTTWATGAHLQAVIGTDDRAGLLIIRDPTHAHYAEAHLEGFIKDYEAHGPRGMLVLPESARSRTDGIALPDAPLYDMLHAVERALESHQRATAQQWYDRLSAAAPGHRLTWQAHLSLAGYDDNPVKAHEAQNALAAMFPDDAAVAWRAFRANAPRRPRAESLAELERRSRDPKCDPVFTGELARLLADDDRTVQRATRLLHRMLRRNPSDAQALTTLAQCHWTARAFDDALELYRFAATAADKNETCAASYFNACRRLNRAEEGLTFLLQRVAEFGHLSAAPHLTLADALNHLLRGVEATQVIRAARALRPEDGELLLYEAQLHLAQGHFTEAEPLLAQVKTLVPPQQWHRPMAALERARGRPADCIAHWQAVLSIEPMALDAHEHIAQLLAEKEGLEQALMLLGRTCMQWPWHMGLARLHVDWLRRVGRTESETELRRILAHNPADDWAWRELALELSHLQRHDEAVAAAAESLRLAPSFAFCHSVHSLVLRAAGRKTEAHAAARLALELDVNCGAMPSLLATADGITGRRECMVFLRGELTRQTAGGEAVAQFHAVAMPLLTTEEMTAILQEGHRARPDIWETWSTLASHLLNQQSPEAIAITREMTVRFPWAPGSWRLHSQACGFAGLREERLSALQHAVDIAPQWSQAVRDLAELHEREGRVETALQEMERVVRANPLEGPNHGVFADMLLRQGRTEEGIKALERAIEVDPGYDWGWGELGRQCHKQNTPQRLITAVQRLMAGRPDEARSWIVLVECHARIEQWTEALAEADRALQRWPKNIRLHELRALIFNATGRRQEACQACVPQVFDGHVPRELRGRHASLLLEAAEYAEAMQILEDLVNAEPDYSWPRSLLYDVYRARGDNARCLELSSDLVRIEPENPVAAGMLAESLTSAGKPDEAMTAVRRALELDPRYTYAADRLFEDMLQRRDFTSASELARLIDRYQRGPRSFLARARLGLARESPNEALPPAMELIECDDSEAESALLALHEAWQKTESRGQLDEMILNAVRDGRARNPGVSSVWVKQHQPKRVIKDIRAALALNVPPAVRDTIIRDLLYQASDTKSQDAALRAVKGFSDLLRVWYALFCLRRRRLRAVKEFRDLLRERTMLWGAVSYVMLQAGWHRELIEWCADWKERQDREPWMVSNLGMALAWECGPVAAAEAWEEVLAAGASNVWTHAAAGLAFTYAIKGRPGDARRLLDNLHNQELSPEDESSAAYARAALAAAESGPGRSPQNRKTAADIMRRVAQSWPDGNATSRGKHYRREMKHFVNSHGFEPAFAKVPRAKTSHDSGHDFNIRIWLWVVIGVTIIGLLKNYDSDRSPEHKVKYSDRERENAKAETLERLNKAYKVKDFDRERENPALNPETQKKLEEIIRRSREKVPPVNPPQQEQSPRRPSPQTDFSPSLEFEPTPPEVKLDY